MLKKLRIEQFVIIDRLELDLQSGLTILTGETGAGKSILLDAMGLVLGEPSTPESIRAGSEQSVIEALFAPAQANPVWQFLIAQGLAVATDTEFRIYRTLKLRGTEEVLLNDKPIELDLLKKIGTFLVEIHGQFANQSLLEPSNQLTLLDLSGSFPPEIFKNVADALHDVHRFTRELEEENNFLANHRREAPKIEQIVAKFEKLGMKDGYIEEVTAEYARLLTAKETSEAFQDILAQLIAANGVVMNLSSAHHTLTTNENLDKDKMEHLSKLLATSLENARAAVKEMRRIAPDYDIDTAPIYHYEGIIEGLKQISKETKIPWEGLQEYFGVQYAKRERIRQGRDKVAELQDNLIKAKNTYRHHAHILTQKRIEAGVALSAAITAELAPLKLLRAEFKVKVEERPDIPWTERGLNEVTFMARMNAGQDFSPVSDTASGGELARLILALKVVLQKVQTIPTLVFDEVDTGIGGAAAAAVGERIAQLSDTTQVLTITHSPQVAARSHQHLHVSKQSDGITTTSIVRQLSRDETVDEISRMLAGDVITPESRAAAKSLIDEAEKASVVRKQKLQEAVNQASAPVEQTQTQSAE